MHWEIEQHRLTSSWKWQICQFLPVLPVLVYKIWPQFWRAGLKPLKMSFFFFSLRHDWQFHPCCFSPYLFVNLRKLVQVVFKKGNLLFLGEVSSRIIRLQQRTLSTKAAETLQHKYEVVYGQITSKHSRTNLSHNSVRWFFMPVVYSEMKFKHKYYRWQDYFYFYTVNNTKELLCLDSDSA